MDREAIALEARKELARRFFYDYNQLKYPRHYGDERVYLKVLCEKLQAFLEQNEKRFFIVNIPPRHYKSFTGTNLVEWYFGQKPDGKAMTGSYNETLSTTFARKVRNTIEEKPTPGNLVYSDIFPNTRVKYGQASASLWALEGSSQDNYLATSPTGTATGFGANLILIDDVIKNAEEAYNELKLDKDWSWLVNTMLSRTEGDDWKVIIIMTRWATNDLAGRVLDAYGDQVELVTFKAVQDDGSMLCDDVLTRKDFELKTKEMNTDIVAANYNQEPIDISGRLFGEFQTYDEVPGGKHLVRNYTDTADKGVDFLCSVNYIHLDGDIYVTDVEMSDAPMEETEPAVAAMLTRGKVFEAEIESNNGGRGFARNVARILHELENKKTIVTDIQQTQNKESRILASSAWVPRHIFMPAGWKQKWPAFYVQLFAYLKKGKNKHDDAPDVLAAIFERWSQPDLSKHAPTTGGDYSNLYPQKKKVMLRSKQNRAAF